MFNGQVHFWYKFNRYKLVTFKITCQSSQGHLLSRESIDFLGYCSCLLEKVKGRSFKCKLTEFVSWDFKYFWFQCKVMENLVFDPQWAHICTAKGPRIVFLSLTYSFIGTSNHIILPQEVTCFHMSKVMLAILNYLNLYLYIELSWIWIVTFCAFVNFICEGKLGSQPFSFPNTLYIHWNPIDFNVELKIFWKSLKISQPVWT